ncbi:acyl-CoA dehydrogenase, partial [Streptomyces sp. MBT33]|nr:acyl-CoA dehydrogenase [Streptomyces sp. MBT33]
LDYAKGYVQERKQFGKPIADFQGIQFMLADMAMKIAAAPWKVRSASPRSEAAAAW